VNHEGGRVNLGGFKQDTIRLVPKLAPRADQQALYLSLPNSGPYLQSVLNLPRIQKKAKPSWVHPALHDSSTEQVERFTDMYFELARLEDDIETHQVPPFLTISTAQSRCIKLAGAMSDLFTTVGMANESNPERMSLFILNVFVLWVRFDKEMTQICPLLSKFHPVFNPELLDALHLPTTSGMQRLLDIQNYFQNQCKKRKQQKTMFFEPDKHGFIIKYVAQSVKMQARLHQIQKSSSAARRAKDTELERWQQEYDEHSSGISGGTSICTFNRDGSQTVKGYTKCWHWRKRNRMEIYAHEDFFSQGRSESGSSKLLHSTFDFLSG
jgi:hypothetical protein